MKKFEKNLFVNLKKFDKKYQFFFENFFNFFKKLKKFPKFENIRQKFRKNFNLTTGGIKFFLHPKNPQKSAIKPPDGVEYWFY